MLPKRAEEQGEKIVKGAISYNNMPLPVIEWKTLVGSDGNKYRCAPALTKKQKQGQESRHVLDRHVRHTNKYQLHDPEDIEQRHSSEFQSNPMARDQLYAPNDSI